MALKIFWGGLIPRCWHSKYTHVYACSESYSYYPPNVCNKNHSYFYKTNQSTHGRISNLHSEGNWSCLQMTVAALLSQSLSPMAPQIPFLHISTLPSISVLPPTSRTSPCVQPLLSTQWVKTFLTRCYTNTVQFSQMPTQAAFLYYVSCTLQWWVLEY